MGRKKKAGQTDFFSTSGTHCCSIDFLKEQPRGPTPRYQPPFHPPCFPDLRRKETKLFFGRQLINKQQNKNTSINIPFSYRPIPIIPPTSPPSLQNQNFSPSPTIQKREKKRIHHSSGGARGGQWGGKIQA